MPLLTLNSFSVSLTTCSTTLLDSVDAVLTQGDCVGLVGKNGSGKSTLLQLLALSPSEQPTDHGATNQDTRVDNNNNSSYCASTSGKIEGTLSPTNRPPGSVLMVTQDKLSWSELLLPKFGNDGGDDQTSTEKEEEIRQMSLPEALEFAVAEASCLDDEKLVARALEDEESWRRLFTAASTAGLGWDLAHYDTTPLGKLSPGCAWRAYIAITIHRPDVELILLDEPTNHLDLPSIVWLEHSIRTAAQQNGKTFIVVSHDESFLDAVVDHIWEIDTDALKLHVSKTNYSVYKYAKLMKIQQQRDAYDAQQERHNHLTTVANKLKAASRTGENYQSNDHDLLQRDFKRERAGRSGSKASAIEKFRDSEEKIDKVVEHVPLTIKLEPIDAGMDSSIIANDIQLGYQVKENEDAKSHVLPIPPMSFRVGYGERIAIIGQNGVGKTTLLRTLMGEIPPSNPEGSVAIGRDLRVGNMMQEHESLPREISPRDHVAAVVPNLQRFEGGNRLIKYGLSRYQVDRPIGELNPGARARLLLALFAMRSVNTLILDEPTNHLDEEAIAEAIATIERYKGTVIIVSHDRHFLNSIKFTHTLMLTHARGLGIVESVDSFVEGIEGVVQEVVTSSFCP
eukprot:scaffold3667_cov180-Amphora_coffeaeformis.AAC.16